MSSPVRPVSHRGGYAAGRGVFFTRLNQRRPATDQERWRRLLPYLHEILAAILRAALADEAMATGLKCRISDMQDRLARLQDRAAKRRQIAKDAMVELDLKKLAAPDFTAFIRPGMPALVVLNEDAVPKTYWEPGEPRLRRQVLAYDLKGGAEITGATLSNPEPILSVRVR